MIALASILAGCVAVCLGLISWLVYRNAHGSDELADARIRQAELAGDLKVALANEQIQADRADNEERRANAFDDLLDEVAADGDAAGARARVLAKYTRAASDTDRDVTGPVPRAPDAPAELGMGRDDLLRPGD